jgi:1-acyl-sn-glycerol-3-phosphate acyltransferase
MADLAPVRPPVSSADSFRTFYSFVPSGARRRTDARWLFQRATKLVVWAYMRAFHRFELRYHPDLPRGQPYIAVMSHTSWLDVPALMTADPYDPPTAMIIKSETMRVPFVSWILAEWGAIPVARDGRDITALRRIRRAFDEGRGVCIAPSGTRSPDGRLGPVSPVLARLIVQSDVPVVPVAIVGSYQCMPKGTLLPRPGKIWLDSGPPIDLGSFRGHRLSDTEIEEAARVIRDGIAALLPPSMHPLPGTPALGAYVEPATTIAAG